MHERDDWAGAVTSRSDLVPLSLTVCLQPSPGGGSGSFLGRASDGLNYFVKAPNQAQGGKVLVTEFLVARLGAMIGAPICRGAVIEVPTALAGYQFQPNRELKAGIGHATALVPDAHEIRGAPQRRSDDDNRRRSVGLFALYDWCWGGDEQYLHETSNEWRIYSHDHGWYFPPTGADWNEVELAAGVDVAHPLPGDIGGLDRSEIDEVAERLETINRESLATMLNEVPLAWHVSNSELETLGWFVGCRAAAVAARLRAI